MFFNNETMILTEFNIYRNILFDYRDKIINYELEFSKYYDQVHMYDWLEDCLLSDILEQSTSTYSYLDSKCDLVSHTTSHKCIFSNYYYTSEYSTNKKNDNPSDNIFIFIAFLPHNVFRSLNNFTKNETFKIENSLLCEIFVKFFNIIPMLYNGPKLFNLRHTTHVLHLKVKLFLHIPQRLKIEMYKYYSSSLIQYTSELHLISDFVCLMSKYSQKLHRFHNNVHIII